MTDGTLVLLVGIQSHGQGLETTLAQIAHEELGIDPDRISVRHGDTGISPFGMGTFASRSMVMAGGAVARASRLLREKLVRIGRPSAAMRPGSRAAAPTAGWPGRPARHGRRDRPRRPSAHGRAAARPRPCARRHRDLPAGNRDRRVSYATNGAVVAVDPATGLVELLDFAVAEDCGTMVNPMIVEGQIRGGIVQGIGTALYEEAALRRGRPAAGRHPGDYRMPGAAELPAIKIGHLHTPAAATEYGMKGMGEGGAIAPPRRSPTPCATPWLRSAPTSTRRRSRRSACAPRCAAPQRALPDQIDHDVEQVVAVTMLLALAV